MIDEASPVGEVAKFSRAPRVSKACDFCRNKKIKCDGGTPCSRCAKMNNACSYNYVEKKRAPRSRKNAQYASSVQESHSPQSPAASKDSSQNDQSTDQRLARVESMLLTLVNKLDPSSSLPHKRSNKNAPGSNSALDNDSVPTSPEQASPDEQNYNGQYFGSHCSFSIFSPKGLSYISSRCDDPHAIDRIVSMQREVYYVLYNQYKTRIDPAPETDLIPIPTKALTDRLINAYLETPNASSFVMDEKEIRDRFYYYYENEAREIKRPLKQSDLLILHAIIGSGASALVEKLSKKTNFYDIDKNEIEFLRQVEDKHIMCALFFFHRTTIFGDGLNGVKSILLLIAYSESSLIPDMDYLLISSIVRFGQSIGLHRRETLSGLSEKEAILRKRIWLNCYVYDKDLCLKSGKPPIINDLDVSSLSDDEHLNFIEDCKAKTSLKLKVNRFELNNVHHFKGFLRTLLDSPFGVSRYFENLKLKVAKMCSDTYFNLFSATALDGKSKKDVMTIVQSLNDSFYLFKESIPKFIRPGYKITLPAMGTDEEKNIVYSHVVKLQLSYHLNIMNINKIGMNKNWNDGGVSADLCLDSAREIMRITQGIKATSADLYLCSLFIILSANVTCFSYIIENPTNPSTKDDILLMSRTSDLQRLKCIELQCDPTNTMKFLSIVYVIKNFIKIGIDLYNKSNQIHHQEDSRLLDIPNNDHDISILERELSNCFHQINQKHGCHEFVNSVTNRQASSDCDTTISRASINSNVVQPQTSFKIPTHSGNSVELMNNQISATRNLDQMIPPYPTHLPGTLTDANQNATNNIPYGLERQPKEDGDKLYLGSLGSKALNDLLTESELLDMTYFSQPLFNIPNFVLDDRSPPQTSL